MRSFPHVSREIIYQGLADEGQLFSERCITPDVVLYIPKVEIHGQRTKAFRLFCIVSLSRSTHSTLSGSPLAVGFITV